MHNTNSGATPFYFLTVAIFGSKKPYWLHQTPAASLCKHGCGHPKIQSMRVYCPAFRTTVRSLSARIITSRALGL